MAARPPPRPDLTSLTRHLMITVSAVALTVLSLRAAAVGAAAPGKPATCHIFPGEMVGAGFIKSPGKESDPGSCCQACGHQPGCAAWSFHKNDGQCFLKDNAKQTQAKPDFNLTSGLHPGPTCKSSLPNATRVVTCTSATVHV